MFLTVLRFLQELYAETVRLPGHEETRVFHIAELDGECFQTAVNYERASAKKTDFSSIQLYAEGERSDK